MPRTSSGLCVNLISICRSLSSHPSAVNGEDRPMHIVRRPGCQEHDGSPEVIGLAPTPRWYPVHNGLAADRVVAKGFGIVGIDIAGGDAVDIDPMRSPFIGQGFYQTRECALACRIAGYIDPALEAKRAARKNDLAAAAGDHLPAEFPGEDE